MLGVDVHDVPVWGIKLVTSPGNNIDLASFQPNPIAGASKDPMRQLELIPTSQATCNGTDMDTV